MGQGGVRLRRRDEDRGRQGGRGRGQTSASQPGQRATQALVRGNERNDLTGQSFAHIQIYRTSTVVLASACSAMEQGLACCSPAAFCVIVKMLPVHTTVIK